MIGSESPQTMKALVIRETLSNLPEALSTLKVESRELRSLKAGEVLVKISATPCNPSDLLLLQGKYGNTKTLPYVPGWEGSGTVVAVGAGLLPRLLLGRRVACVSLAEGDGTWAEYCVTSAKQCIPLSASISDEQGASFVVNPLSALGLFALSKSRKAVAVAQTAAMSQLGQMLTRLYRKHSLPCVQIVYRKDQYETLKNAGERFVLDSSDQAFPEQLARMFHDLKVSVALDAVAGESPSMLLNALPAEGTVVLYGVLSEQATIVLDPIELLFEAKRIEGFYLKTWLESRSLIGKMIVAKRATTLIADGTLSSEIAERVPLSEASNALSRYCKQMSKGKVLMVPAIKEDQHM